MNDESITAFIDRWTKSGGAERANYQLFLAELCDVPTDDVHLERQGRFEATLAT